MAKKSKRMADEDIELNMTPMIDVVFNLIIFFMIVTDMSQKELEDLVLPDSKTSMEDKADEKDLRVIVNISMKNRNTYKQDREVLIKIKGVEYDLKALKSELYKVAETKREEDHDAKPSAVYVLIRCDAQIAWREVQWVMQACADPTVRIYKIQFATKEWETD
jgi:biopolymer transport protein ExbD